jgi:predicted nucleic acid-binding protein
VNGWLLDTNVISEMSGAKADRKVAKWFNAQAESSLFLSILTLAEYRKGIEHLPPGDKLRPHLQRAVVALEGRFSGRILSVTDQIVLRWGAISDEVKRIASYTPSVVDALFAATAIEHGLYLATRNVLHVAHSGAAVFNPWKDDPAHFRLGK